MTSATICRISGKLATDACRDVETIDRDGYPVRESMGYTEYFARGTEPIDYCLWHTHFSFPGVVAMSTPAPSAPGVQAPTPAALSVPIATTGTFPAALPVPAPVIPRAEQPPVPRQGFWGRFFRRGARKNATNPAPITNDLQPRRQPDAETFISIPGSGALVTGAAMRAQYGKMTARSPARGILERSASACDRRRRLSGPTGR